MNDSGDKVELMACGKTGRALGCLASAKHRRACQRCPRVMNGTASVRLSFPSARCSSVGGFAAVGPAGGRYRPIAARATAQQHGTAARRAAANAGSATFSAYVGG